MKNISMILSSCDKYEDAWVPFCKQLKSNWPSFNMPVYLNTENKSFSFEGMDIRTPFSGKNIQYKQWSDRLLKLLAEIEEDYILFFLDDFWLTASVNEEKFERIFSYMKKDHNIGFVCLKQELKDYSSQKDKDSCVDCEYPELWQCNNGKSFRITTQVGIWKKSYLIKILRAHESVWYFETRATKRACYYREKVYDAKESVFVYPIGGFLGGGQCYEDYINLYPAEVTADCIKKRGTIKFGGIRNYPPNPKGFLYYWGLFKSALPKWF